MIVAPPAVSLRLAREEDIDATYGVMLAAAADLSRKLGRIDEAGAHSPAERALAVRRAALRHDPDRFWVAESNGAVVGFGMALRRGHHVYLAALHVLPAFQGSGIGAELLRRCMAAPAPSSPRLTISEAANIASTGLYCRSGLLPVAPILQVSGDPAACPPPADRVLRAADGNETAAVLRRFDAATLGIERDVDHETWQGIATLTPYLLFGGDQVLGYVYVDDAGFLGPAAALSAEHLADAVALGLARLAEKGIQTAHLRIPGMARPALSMLIGHGFRLEVGINLLLSNVPINGLDRYLFSGADALF